MRRLKTYHSEMWRYINLLPKGTLFVSRDLLAFAPRANVDSFVWYNIKMGFLRRAARGVFFRADPGLEFPSIQAIVKAKARAFAREMAVDFADRSAALGLIDEGNNLPTFSITGCSSMFITETGVPIYLRGRAPRKLLRLKRNGSQYVQAIWHVADSISSDRYLQDSRLREFHEQILKKHLNISQRKAFRDHFKWMPKWMSDWTYSWDWMNGVENRGAKPRALIESLPDIVHFGSFAGLPPDRKPPQSNTLEGT